MGEIYTPRDVLFIVACLWIWGVWRLRKQYRIEYKSTKDPVKRGVLFLVALSGMAAALFVAHEVLAGLLIGVQWIVRQMA